MDDKDRALTQTGLGALVEAVELAGRIVVQAISSSVEKFNLFAASNDLAFTELGLQNTSASTVFLGGQELGSLPTSGTASLNIEINNDGDLHEITVDFAGT